MRREKGSREKRRTDASRRKGAGGETAEGRAGKREREIGRGLDLGNGDRVRLETGGKERRQRRKAERWQNEAGR